MEELMGQMLTLMIILLSPGQNPTPLGLRALPFPVPLCPHRGLAAPIACGVLTQERDASALPQGLSLLPKHPEKGSTSSSVLKLAREKKHWAVSYPALRPGFGLHQPDGSTQPSSAWGSPS